MKSDRIHIFNIKDIKIGFLDLNYNQMALDLEIKNNDIVWFYRRKDTLVLTNNYNKKSKDFFCQLVLCIYFSCTKMLKIKELDYIYYMYDLKYLDLEIDYRNFLDEKYI